jgi:TolA-binding protein
MRASFSIDRTIAFRIFLILPFVVAAIALGCTGAIRGHSPSEQPASVPALDIAGAAPMQVSAWESAVNIFKAGDYYRAMDLFQTMTSEAGDQEISRKAHFGLAAARLAIAKTPEEFNAALDVWKLWSDQTPMNLKDEDPRILTPFLERFRRSEEMQALITDPLPSIREPKRSSIPKAVMPGSATARSEYRSLLREKEKEIDRLKSRLESREREVKRLRHQIESLEEIHLKFQERKQETSTP